MNGPLALLLRDPNRDSDGLGSRIDTAPLLGSSETYVGVLNEEGTPEIVAMSQ